VNTRRGLGAHARRARKSKTPTRVDACHATEARRATPAAPRPRRDDAERARVGIALSRLSSDGDDTLARASESELQKIDLTLQRSF